MFVGWPQDLKVSLVLEGPEGGCTMQPIFDWLFTPHYPSMWNNAERLICFVIVSATLVQFCRWLFSQEDDLREIYRVLGSYIRGSMSAEYPKGCETEEKFLERWDAIVAEENHASTSKPYYLRVTELDTGKMVLAAVGVTEMEVAEQIEANFEELKMRVRGSSKRRLRFEIFKLGVEQPLFKAEEPGL